MVPMNIDIVRSALIMTPDVLNFRETWGVFNPASARSRTGELFLFPRAVAAGNYSRIAVAGVTFDPTGNPAGVRRLGVALEPKESYERFGRKDGGVEDPRITYVPLLDKYVMSYVALGPDGPRGALAVSDDLFAWRRLGLLQFQKEDDLDLNTYINKDCVLFPRPVLDPSGKPAFAILHRPLHHVQIGQTGTDMPPPEHIGRRPSIWISYTPIRDAQTRIESLAQVYGHRALSVPVETWESDRIGAGPPPVLTDAGWLLFYHGVRRIRRHGDDAEPLITYCGGAMMLDRDDPRRILWRSERPVLRPSMVRGRYGHVPRVVFPTGVDVRDQTMDIYCGAADTRIGAVTVRLGAHILEHPSAPEEFAARPAPTDNVA